MVHNLMLAKHSKKKHFLKHFVSWGRSCVSFSVTFKCLKCMLMMMCIVKGNKIISSLYVSNQQFDRMGMPHYYNDNVIIFLAIVLDVNRP